MKIIAIGLMLIAAPATAGTVTCAGKAYHDIEYANLTTSPSTYGIVRLWTVEVKDAIAAKHITPQFTLILNSDVMCELQDIKLHLVDVATGPEGE